ncbi:MAG TPA: hypothetical protein VF549_00410 [Solirubrobacteraceae bacterium]|jgi:hypothetical protein
MKYERSTKRMDDAVESSWLRGLRSQARAMQGSSSRNLLGSTPRAKAPAGKLDRSIAAGVDR